MIAPLETSGLGRSYGRLVALADLSVSVAAGECVALIGANGSGKSTAVRTIAGLLEPSEGSVRVVRGRSAPRAGGGAGARRDGAGARLAGALRRPDGPPAPRARHALARGRDDEVDARIASLLARLGLAARGDFLPRELSRGMRQKTQLACALIRPASVLVLDEPVVGLDPPSQVLLHELLCERKRAGTAVLLTTHQMAFADGLADRGVRLEDGVVADAGPWPTVRERARVRGWTSP